MKHKVTPAHKESIHCTYVFSEQSQVYVQRNTATSTDWYPIEFTWSLMEGQLDVLVS